MTTEIKLKRGEFEVSDYNIGEDRPERRTVKGYTYGIYGVRKHGYGFIITHLPTGSAIIALSTLKGCRQFIALAESAEWPMSMEDVTLDNIDQAAEANRQMFADILYQIV